MHPQSPSVLVVGGSLVGLSSALFLAWRGVPTVLVETHLGSHTHPRAVGFTPRTMELFATVGLRARIPHAPAGFRLLRAKVESLAGTWHEASDWTPPTPEAPRKPTLEVTQYTGAAIAQDRLEPILRERAVELGADLRMGTELLRFEEDTEGVTAWLRDRQGNESTLRSSYLIAADGGRSPIREALGLGREGPGPLRVIRSVLFRAPLEQYLDKGISQFEIEQPDFQAFLTTYGDGRWVLMADDQERDEAAWKKSIERAIGRSDLPIEILTTGRWELSAAITDAFRSVHASRPGRVFLAGDSAHTLPPTRGGFGANTGIHDAHNLAWKLSAVLAGTSSPSLLDTYDAERRPVAWGRLEQTFARPDYAKLAPEIAARVAILDEDAMELGELYRSASVIGAGPELPPAARPEVWAGQPGTRAPHLWMTRGGERLSSLVLLERSWVLWTESESWNAAAATAFERLGVPITVHRMGSDVEVDLHAFRRALGIGPEGASLIRPDGFVAWRSIELPSDPATALTEALGRTSAAVRWVHPD